MEIFKLFGSILIKSDEADKSIQKTESKAGKLATAFGNGIKTAAKWGAGLVTAAAGAATAVVGAIFRMDEATQEYRENMAKLTAAWEASKGGAELAKQAYTGLYSVIGDQDTATEAAQLMAKLAANTQDVATWTDIAAGVTGTFGDALPINSLIEAANETAKVGTVTGALADALNWAGISEDEFNAKLAACSTEQERNQLITETLSSTYQDATEAYKENNAQLIEARENQARLDEATGALGGAVAELKNKLMSDFAPALAGAGKALAEMIRGSETAKEDLVANIRKMVESGVERLPEFIDLGLEIIFAIGEGLIRALPKLLLKVPYLVMQIIDKFLELGPDLFNAGKEMLQELWDGLASVWNDVYKWVSGKVAWIADKLFFWRSSKDEMNSDDVDGSHASGLPYVPYDGYRAILHKGETVVNADDTRDLLQSIKKIAETGGMGETITIVVQPTLDGKIIGESVTKYQRNQERAVMA